MRWIKYQIVQSTNDEETILANKKVVYNDENLAIARTEAYGGEYEVIEDSKEAEIEWLNPPMMEGVEYRTAERYNGLPVYVKRVSLKIKVKADDDGNSAMIEVGPPVESKIIDIVALFRSDDTGATKNDVWIVTNSICEIQVVPFMYNMYGKEDYKLNDIFIYNIKVNGTIELTMKYVKEG